MSYDTVNYEDVEPKAPGMFFLRDALDCSNLGVTVIDVDAGWTGKEHDHADEGQEEVYVLLEGNARIAVDGDDVELSPGDAIRVDPDASREIEVGDEPATFVVAGAP